MIMARNSKLALAVMACMDGRPLNAAIESGCLSKSDIRTINALRSSGGYASGDIAKRKLTVAIHKRFADRDRTLRKLRTLIEDYARDRVMEMQKKETNAMVTTTADLLAERVAKSRDIQRMISETVRKYQAAHPGCSRQDAIDKILFGPGVREIVDFERRIDEVVKLGGGKLPQYTDASLPWGWPLRGAAGYDSSNDGRPPHNPDAGEEPTIHDHNELLEQIKSGQIPFADARVSALVRLERKAKFGS
jgi:hypothetical protein